MTNKEIAEKANISLKEAHLLKIGFFRALFSLTKKNTSVDFFDFGNIIIVKTKKKRIYFKKKKIKKKKNFKHVKSDYKKFIKTLK